jgi:hypothetical protein
MGCQTARRVDGTYVDGGWPGSQARWHRIPPEAKLAIRRKRRRSGLCLDEGMRKGVVLQHMSLRWSTCKMTKRVLTICV